MSRKTADRIIVLRLMPERCKRLFFQEIPRLIERLTLFLGEGTETLPRHLFHPTE